MSDRASAPAVATAERAATPSLGGRTIALLEARRGTELGQLVATYGGVPRHAPALREEPVEDPDAITAALDVVAQVGLSIAIFQTGVGARALFRGVDALGRGQEWRERLARATVVVRGPKPDAVLRELGVRVDRRAAEPYTTAELLETLRDRPLAGAVVIVQHYGEPNAALTDDLRARGARVLELDVYRWALPEDTAPIEALLRDLPTGRIDALVVTSQAQVAHLFAVAERLGLAASLPEVLARHTLVAAVGPVAARALAERGVRVDLQPAHPKMGQLIRELALHMERT